MQEYRELHAKLTALKLNGRCNDHEYDMRMEKIDALLGESGLRIIYRKPITPQINCCTLLDECAGDMAMVADEEEGDLHELVLWVTYGSDSEGRYQFHADF